MTPGSLLTIHVYHNTGCWSFILYCIIFQQHLFWSISNYKVLKCMTNPKLNRWDTTGF